MRKIRLIICVLVVIVCFSGCGKVAKSNTWQTTMHGIDGVRGLERSIMHLGAGDADKFGISKSLIFVCGDVAIANLDPDVVTKFNELLVSKYGCDFVVEFISGDIIADKYGYTYYDFVSDIKVLGQQADILMAMTPAKYSTLIKEGYFIGLKEYMEETELGQKMYSSYPEVIWEMLKKDGEIFGYAPFCTATNRYALVCNKGLAKELDLNVQEGFSFYEIGDILSEVNVQEQLNADVIEIFASKDALFRMLGYCDMGYGIYGKKDFDGSWKALYPAADEEFMTMCKKLQEYNKKGWLKISDYIGLGIQEIVAEGNFIFWFNNIKDANMVGNKIKLSAYYAVDRIYEVIRGDIWYGYYPTRESLVYGVTTWSKYQKEALDLIALIQTEEELSNLLLYGIEGEHYVYQDGKVIELPNEYHGMGDKFMIINPNITLSEFLEPDDKLGYYKELAKNYEYNPAYSMDRTPYLEQLKVLLTIYEEYETGLLTGTYEDVEAAIAELDKRLKEAGIEQIIDAYNKQLQVLQ